MVEKGTKIYIALGIIIILIVIWIYATKLPQIPDENEDLAKCIGENSLVYSSLTCSACKAQKKLFGDNYKYINEIDCLYQADECGKANILGTPTWVINGEKYPGLRTIEELKELTGC